MQQLTNALIAAQKLEKKCRQLRNQGKVTDAQVDRTRQVVGTLRKLCEELGVESVDIDSRGERKKH